MVHFASLCGERLDAMGLVGPIDRIRLVKADRAPLLYTFFSLPPKAFFLDAQYRPTDTRPRRHCCRLGMG